ncbi:GIY-YIG nuclease family protein [Paenibacillus sp. FSL K6-2524]|uniref:GIY-YIG nuclease family protein n=1 Tax=Paenibacillus sp. FSL K6-2524 TaxID=2954516 RepID=UPI0030F768EA
MINSIDALEGLIEEIENQLLQSKKYSLYSDNWTKELPSYAGIYIIRNGEKIVYVGETANIKDRMKKDMKNTQNHTIRRNIGKYHYSNHSEYYPATSKKKFAPSIESLINEYCSKFLTVSFAVVHVGRLEVEEFLIMKYEPIYNAKTNSRSHK